MPEFPHMQKHEFPKGSNVDVYRYDNAFDYARYDFEQMEIQVCTVPWDMGEAHVGNRTISGIGNVVFFGSKEKRNAWFDAIPDDECFRWETKSKELHRENIITVPLPFDVASKYNYVCVHYHLFANDESPVMYEDDSGLNDWFWFIREVEFVSPNTTKLHLLNDAWQTFIYDVDIPYMVLERGHAPMDASDVESYLAAPMDNCRYLLADDVRSDNARTNIETLSPLVFDDGNIFVVFVTSANVRKAWGTEYSNAWRTRTSTYYVQDGQLSYTHFAVAAENFNDFVNKLDADVPQFAQCVECVYLVSSELVSIRETLSFMGFDVHLLSADERRKMLFELDRDAFGYPDAYKDIAKLYTYPYAYIDVQDEKGNSCVVRIEEMASSRLDVQCALNTAFPTLNIYACLVGIGERAESSITFTALANRQVHIGGKRFETSFEWALPKFGVFQDRRAEWDFAGYFVRAQQENDYTTAYENGLASASMHRINAGRSADTAKANADRSADTGKANADRSADTSEGNAVRSANAERNNTYRNADTSKANTTLHTAGIATQRDAKNAESNRVRNIANYLVAQQARFQKGKINVDEAADNAYISAGFLANVDTITASAWTNAAGGIAGGAITGAVSGIVAGGPVGAATGAAIGATGGIIAGIGASVSANIVISKEQSLLTASLANLHAKSTAARDVIDNQSTYTREANNRSYSKDVTYNNAVSNNNISILDNQASNTQQTSKTNADTTRIAAIDNAADTQTTMKANASATQSMERTNATATQSTDKANASYNHAASVDNAADTYDTETANLRRTRTNEIARIQNHTYDLGLEKPFTYGVFADGESATTRPKMLIPRIVHDSMADITYAGDAMLRYGYYLNQNWAFDGSWCLDGHKFTYWKLADFWVQGLNVPDMYMDRLRFFLFGGVTVWASPEDIGRTSIYENGY